MAARGRANSTVTAIGVAAGAGAAQFGLAYGLGIIAWQPVRGATGESLWLASLTWTLWIAASSTVLGAVYAGGSRSRGAFAKSASRSGAAGNAADHDDDRRRGHPMDLVSRTAIALAAAIGALITVPLVMLPARAAQRADTFQPEVTAGAYAVVGVIVGLVIAVAAVNVRVIATNVVVSTAWVWALAAVSVVDAERANRTVGTAQLAAWQFSDRGWLRETLYVPGALLMLGGALLVAVFAALLADRRGDNRVGIAISGTFGPLLVAAAYLLAAPDLTLRALRLSPNLFAPYAVVGGLAGSIFVAVLGPMRPRRARAVAAAPLSPLAGDPKPARGADEAELTEWTRTLATGSPQPPVVFGRPQPATATTGGDAATVSTAPVTVAADATASPATGRATVNPPVWPIAAQPTSPTITQPFSPHLPNQRTPRGSDNPAAW
jgi:hypothetical protein